MNCAFGDSTDMAYPILLCKTGTDLGVDPTASCEAEYYLTMKGVQFWPNFEPKLPRKGRAGKTTYVASKKTHEIISYLHKRLIELNVFRV